MSISFPFRKEKSPIFGNIHRPVAEVFFKEKLRNLWQPVTMIVDTGADYTLFPLFLAKELGELHRNIPIGFLDNDYIPPLLGRQEFLETFKVIFEKFHVTFI